MLMSLVASIRSERPAKRSPSRIIAVSIRPIRTNFRSISTKSKGRVEVHVNNEVGVKTAGCTRATASMKLKLPLWPSAGNSHFSQTSAEAAAEPPLSRASASQVEFPSGANANLFGVLLSYESVLPLAGTNQYPAGTVPRLEIAPDSVPTERFAFPGI